MDPDGVGVGAVGSVGLGVAAASRCMVVVNRYLDSVALLRLSSEMRRVEGVTMATAVMATPTNLDAARHVGIDVEGDAAPSDVFVGAIGSESGCAAALQLASERLAAAEHPGIGSAAVPRAATFQQFRRGGEGAELALISVPGVFAAAEAGKALDLGMNVMIFSDNVTVSDELALKEQADGQGLLVMGPDCGTAIINGVPLGFANDVRRGRIGVIGASGTGMQEVTSRVHRLGAGISQAIGCGGRDLNAIVRGRTMRAALALLATDTDTDVIVLVSKPPAPGVLAEVIAGAQVALDAGKQLVAVFVGLDGDALGGTGIAAAASLADAADLAVALAAGDASTAPTAPAGPPDGRGAVGGVELGAVAGRVIRGAFVGGTFAHEAAHLFDTVGLADLADRPVSDHPVAAASSTAGGSWWRELIDFGDDEYTIGRPHPMIDPSRRDAWICSALDDPTTALVLFDVVLGFGAHDRPVEGLLAQLHERNRPGRPALIAHVCGTERDAQQREVIIAELTSAGVLVADSNIEAARWAASIVSAFGTA